MAKIVRKKYPNDFRIKIAKEADAGSIADVAKKHKLAENNVYNWRATFRKYGEAGFVGVGKRGPRANSTPVSLKSASVGPNKAHLRKKLEKAAGQALSGLLGEVVVDLRTSLAAEQKRRVAAEKALLAVRSRLQKIIKG